MAKTAASVPVLATEDPEEAAPSPMDAKEITVEQRLVHLDLKGAPPKISYFEQLFPLLHNLGATGLLVEYEDMFPYSGELSVLAAPHAYSTDEIGKLLQLAANSELQVIPLIQTFGHFEFVLKHKQFVHLRELPAYSMALCPLKEESFSVVTMMVDQMMDLHPAVSSIHIGADEVIHLACCDRCTAYITANGLTPIELFFEHVRKVLVYIREKYPGVTAIMWDDMFRGTDLATLKSCGLTGLVQPMVWFYERNFCLPENLWDRLSQVFSSVWAASAFKGATGSCKFVTDITAHAKNHCGWMEIVERDIKPKFEQFHGYAITGWQRYDHFAGLCELLPVGVPCLTVCLLMLQAGAFSESVHQQASADLGFTDLIPLSPLESSVKNCTFPGSTIYTAMHHLLHVHRDFNLFIASDRLNGWMSNYHLQNNFVNPFHVSFVLSDAQILLQNFRLLDVELQRVLPEVFYQVTIEELIAVLIKPKIDSLLKFEDTAQNVLARATQEVSPH